MGFANIIIWRNFILYECINMKNLVNVLSIVVLLWTNILTPISYAVEEGFIESEPVVEEENVSGEEVADNVWEEYTPLDNAQTDESEKSESGNISDVSWVSNDNLVDQDENVGEKSNEKSWEDIWSWNVEESEEIWEDIVEDIEKNAENLNGGEKVENEESKWTWENEEDVMDLEAELEVIETWDLQLLEWSGEYTSITVTHNANGWKFSDGSEEKVAVYSGINFKKVLHTSNVDDDWNQIPWKSYPENSTLINSVTIPWARSLHVKITYQTYYNSSSNWISIYSGWIVPTTSNYGSSISNMLYSSSMTTKEYDVPWDTVQILFKTYYSSSSYYWYYAVIEWEWYTTEEDVLPKNEWYWFVWWTMDAEWEWEIVGGVDNNGIRAIGEEVEDNTTVYAKWDKCYKYQVTNENKKEARLSEYSMYCKDKDIEIPQEIDGYTITSIWDNVFRSRGINSVILPDTIVNIWSYAFAYNNIGEIELPASLENIWYYAFYNIWNPVLWVKKSGWSYLYNDPGYTYINISDEWSCFWFDPNNGTINWYNVNLCWPNVEIPSEIWDYIVTQIWSYAFRNLWITSVKIPNTVAYINGYAFANNQIESVSLGLWVNIISGYAFMNNNLKDIELPKSLSGIYYNAFAWNVSKPVKWIRKNWIQWLSNNDYSNIVIYTWNIDEDDNSGCFVINGGQITNYYVWQSGCVSDVIIPSEINGVQITSIWDSAFNDKWITSVVIPETITGIWYSAFKGNYIKEVEIPWTVTSIWSEAFEYNDIERLIIWSWVMNIWNWAFYYNNLKGVEIPWSVTSIWNGAFRDNDIERLIIWSWVTSISDWAFYDNNLKGVEIPWSVTGISYRAFGNNGIERLIIWSWVTSISDYAFYNNNIEYVEIPESVINIWYEAFDRNAKNPVIWYRKNWTEWLANEPNSYIKIVKNIVDGCFVLSGGAVMNYNIWYSGCASDVIIPSEINGMQVTKIWDSAFYKKWITSVVIPETVTNIWQSAFAYNNIEEVEIPWTVTNIWYYAFYNNAKNPVIWYRKNWIYWLSNSDSYLKIEVSLDQYSWCFAVMSGVLIWYLDSDECDKDVVIPSEISWEVVTAIWNETFRGRWITSVVIPDTVKTIWNSAFYGNQLSWIIIPEWVTNIWYNAFSGNKLTKVELPSTLTWIWNYAFYGNQLSELIVPNSVKNVWSNAFCSNKLKWVVWYRLAWTSGLTNNSSNSCLVIRVDENDAKCYEITSKWEITNYYGWISGCTTWLVEIPSVINGVQVKSIWSSMFNNMWITWVVIPEWVTSIWSYAFQNNLLTKVELPSTIKTIWYSVFYNNTFNPVIWYVWSTGWMTNNSSYIKLVTPEMIDALSGCFSFDSEKWEILNYYAWYKEECGENVEIPSEIDGVQVKSIWTWAFRDKWISSVVIPEWITNIWYFAFYNNKLAELDLPTTLTGIWSYAFSGNLLTEVKLFDNVESIWSYAFCGHGRVLAVREWLSGWITMWNDTCLYFVESGASVTTEWCYEFNKEKWEIIKYNTWENCGTDVEIPSQIGGVEVKSILDNAFSSKWITSLIVPEWVNKIWNNTFSSNKIKSLSLPSSVEYIWDYAFAYNNQLSDVEIKSWRIWEEAFYSSSSSLKSLKLGMWVTEIWREAFYYHQLTELEIPWSVKNIWYWAFRGNYNVQTLKKLIIGDGVENIWDYAFEYHQLTELVVPWSVKNITSNTFYSYGNSTLTKLVIEDGVENIWNYAFEYYNQLSDVEIKSWRIWEYAFYNYSTPSLKNLKLGTWVTEIWRYAFEYHKLTELEIPWSVKNIWYWAFYGNYGKETLKKLIIEDGVENIWEYAFYAHLLTELEIPWSVKNIWYEAFYGNSSKQTLKELIINEWVTNIWNYAFAYNKLSRLELPDSLQYIWNYAFYGRHSLKFINVPESLKVIEWSAFCNYDNSSIRVLWIVTKPVWEIHITSDPYVDFVRWYSVTYDTQWWTEIEKQVYLPWSTIKTPTNPTKTGYNFGWWEPEMPQKMPMKNIVVSAVWNKWDWWSSPTGGGWWGWWSSSDKTKDENKEIWDWHNVAEEKQDISTWAVENEIETWKKQDGDEVENAYRWAYAHEVTTMPTLQKANPDGVVKRGHMAKMVVNFVVNVMWKEEPKEIPAQCSRWDEAKDRESQEIKWYAEKACALWIMWINVKTFAPNRVVTRAEFGTVLSRILRWNKYDVEKASRENPYYKKHLEALKAEWIMTQIENPTKREEKRKWVRVMLSRVGIEK